MIRRLALFLAVVLVAAPAAALEPTQYQNLLTPLLSAETDTLGAPVVYPAGTPKITSAIVTIPPGGETGWHIHRVPLFVYILEGEVTVDYGSKGVKVVKAGESMMEAMNWNHNGMNKGDVPVKILAVYMGGGESANTAMEAGPQ
jgi:quercetin dioxygenase-like cupin family protein